MKKITSIAIITISLCFSTFLSFGQTTDICAEGDCAPTILTTSINHPLAIDASANNSQRTTDFKKAYDAVLQFQSVHQVKPGWQGKFDASQLGGKSCFRYYQLFTHLGHEYNQNADFKTYVDANYAGTNFTEEAFEHSRRAQNLKQRMSNQCSNELKKINQPPLDELSPAFTKLGQILGYFDKNGKMIKAMKPIAPANTASTQPKVSKKQQIINLKNTVAQLPVGQPTKDKVKDITNALNTAAPKVAAVQSALKNLAPNLTNLLPKPPALLSKIGNLNNILGGLMNFKPKLPRPALMNKLTGLFDKGKDLNKRIKDTVDKSKNLKTRFDKLTKDADKVKNDISNRVKNITDLSDQLKTVEDEKNKMVARLEDRPRKYLEELTKAVGDLDKKAKDLVKNIDIEKTAKDKLMDELKNILDAKDDITNKIKGLEKVVENLTKEQSDLADAIKKAVEEVDSVKLEEAIADAQQKMKDKLGELIPVEELKQRFDICNEDIQKIIGKLQPIEQVQGKLKTAIDSFKDKPQKLLGKISKFTDLQNKLKQGVNGVPAVGQTLAKIDDLLAKSSTINSTVQALSGQNTGLQTKITGISNKLDKVKNGYSLLSTKQDQLKVDLTKLIAKKLDIDGKIDGITKEIAPVEKLVDDFIQRYNTFEGKLNCDETEEIKKELEEIEDEQEAVEPDLTDLEEQLEEVEFEADQIEEETRQVEEVQAQEQAIKEEFGQDIKIEPVQVEEWTEGFEVKRQYWEATFHPDDEVVEGFKGRYFRVNLRDADKEVKLLFDPGKYYMNKDKFRDTYGSTIGAFVIEALNAMKEEDRAKVQVFIQGSADMVGSASFRGNLTDEYKYTDIHYLGS